MTDWLYLSYLIDDNTPVYGGKKTYVFKHDKKIKKGDTCNSMKWSLSNHTGTHIDFPRHFSENGNTVDDYQADFWVIDKIAVLEIEGTKPAQILAPNDFAMELVPESTQLLLVKTGFLKFRSNEIYWKKNPGIHPDVADMLRKECPDLKILGLDTISLSSYADRNLGRDSHKAFLDHNRPILLLEDLDLNQVDNNTALKRVVISPQRVSGADASPCTVLAEVL
jgi:kynurenine formamidase